MNIEHDQHDRYNAAAKSIYGEDDRRRWSDRCRCGGTRADHIRTDPEMLGKLNVSAVSNNNHSGKCGQFTPAANLFFPKKNIHTVVETDDGKEMATDDQLPNPKIKVEGRPAPPTPEEIAKWREEQNQEDD